MEVVISLDKAQAAHVELGEPFCMKARSQPFGVFEVQVQRIAPRAETGDAQSQVNI